MSKVKNASVADFRSWLKRDLANADGDEDQIVLEFCGKQLPFPAWAVRAARDIGILRCSEIAARDSGRGINEVEADLNYFIRVNIVRAIMAAYARGHGERVAEVGDASP